MALYLRQNFITAQYLENKLTEFHQFLFIYFFIIYNRVMALDLCQNFDSAQYLENKFTELGQTLYNYLY